MNSVKMGEGGGGLIVQLGFKVQKGEGGGVLKSVRTL